jgi:NAD(P)H dehydrogenase (quinone)
LPLLHHGMIMCGLPYSESAVGTTTSGGGPYGASHYHPEGTKAGLTAEESDLARALGRRVASIARRLQHDDSTR